MTRLTALSSLLLLLAGCAHWQLDLREIEVDAAFVADRAVRPSPCPRVLALTDPDAALNDVGLGDHLNGSEVIGVRVAQDRGRGIEASKSQTSAPPDHPPGMYC